MEPERFAPSWHAAVERAPVGFFEPDTDEYRWAGGFAGDGSHIGVCGLIDGHKVSVETFTGERRLDGDIIQRLSIDELMSRHLNSLRGEITLPFHVTVESEDRQVTIDATSQTCPGVRIAGDTHWAGSMTVGDVRLRITTTSPMLELAVRVCADPASLSRTPPRSS